MNNLAKLILSEGGEIFPIIIPTKDCTSLLNPSIHYSYTDGKIFMNLRHVQYAFHQNEYGKNFPTRHGPLLYVHPENDITLTTTNFLGTFDPVSGEVDLKKVEMMNLHKPIWEFVGLEDARVVIWEDKFYICGVRRDTTTHGEGRMELCEIEFDLESKPKEIKRFRINPPDKKSYCEKNWMPIEDKPYHFVKWSNPVEVVYVDPAQFTSNNKTVLAETVFKSEDVLNLPRDLRGGSNVVRYDEGYYIMVTHEVDLFRNYLNQKDAQYYHRFVVLDDNFSTIAMSEPFKFMDSSVEFCTGLAILPSGEVLIAFGYQDNAAFVLKTDKSIIRKNIQLITK